MKEIGGYFGLELSLKKEYYPDLLKLNTGRNCLEYILRVRRYSKIYIPYYTCEVILEPINKLGLDYEFYSVDLSLNIVFDKELESNEAIIVNNYFGIKDKQIIKYVKEFKKNVIVDNSQAFYCQPINGIDTFYSVRKFFGVADGAYLAIDHELEGAMMQDTSYCRMSHLLERVDLSASSGFVEYKKNSKLLENQSIKKMSNLTRKILNSINYEKIKRSRERNFRYLHLFLKENNRLNIDITTLNGPMIYPFLCKKEGLREMLIKNNIYIATYWPNVLNWCDKLDNEYHTCRHLLPLPIDQRYNTEDMNRIIKLINL